MSDLQIKSSAQAHAAVLNLRQTERSLRDAIKKSQEEDGGAFPEVYKAQYLPNSKAVDVGISPSFGEVSVLKADSKGDVSYDTICDSNDGRIVHKTLEATLQKEIVEHDNTLALPSEELVKKTVDKTRKALESILESRIKTAQGKNVVTEQKKPVYIKYKPANKSRNPQGPESRIIKIVEAPVDPMEPPRFKHKKIPQAPPSPPAPVMHSPPRKVTAEEQKNWVIPPCISNWKNAKGYTIPLDKRLATDGRGVQTVSINDNFAKLSEALFIADRHAREEVRIRAEMKNRLLAKERQEKEEKLRILAQRSREERKLDERIDPNAKSISELTSEERAKYREREEIRYMRQKQREYEFRLSRMGAETRSRIAGRDAERDVSEKIALGLVQAGTSKESMFDQRLFNQTHGLSSGFADDEAYSLYDKPLFTRSAEAFTHNPSNTGKESSIGAVVSENMEKILGERKKRHFEGAEAMSMGPVKFEKQTDDPFGIDEFMKSAKRSAQDSKNSTHESKKLKD